MSCTEKRTKKTNNEGGFLILNALLAGTFLMIIMLYAMKVMTALAVVTRKSEMALAEFKKIEAVKYCAANNNCSGTPLFCFASPHHANHIHNESIPCNSSPNECEFRAGQWEIVGERAIVCQDGILASN